MTRLRVIIFFFVVLACSQSRAQGNLAYFDDETFHFGFSLGLASMDFGVTPSLQEIDGKVYNVDVSNLSPGFSVGVVTDLRLSRYLNLRVNPTIDLCDRVLVYTADNNATSLQQKVTSIPVCLPVYLKYSSERYRNVRPYLIGGGGVYVDLGRDKTKPLLLNPFDLYVEFGVGCDIYLSFFKLSPELKFALGSQDMLTPLSKRSIELSAGDKIYTNALSKLTTKMITLSFNFE